jgi:hypothetical protein
MNNKKKCFVIMPFSKTKSCTEQKWTEIFEYVIKPAVEESGLGYECERSVAGRENIIKGILEALSKANVVIADLTDSNPSVFYELGVRHTLANRTILVAQGEEHIPFDLKPYPVVFYNESPAKIAQFKNEIKKKLEDIETNPERSDNPVADFLQLRNVAILAHEKAASLRKLDALLSEISFNISEIKNTAKQLAQSLPPTSRLQNTCIKLILSTRYINITADVLNDISLCDRMVDWFNQQLEFAHQSLIMVLDEIPKRLAASIPPIEDKFISLFGSVAIIRIDFANDNYQEPKEQVIPLSTPELEKYLK